MAKESKKVGLIRGRHEMSVSDYILMKLKIFLISQKWEK